MAGCYGGERVELALQRHGLPQRCRLLIAAAHRLEVADLGRSHLDADAQRLGELRLQLGHGCSSLRASVIAWLRRAMSAWLPPLSGCTLRAFSRYFRSASASVVSRPQSSIMRQL